MDYVFDPERLQQIVQAQVCGEAGVAHAEDLEARFAAVVEGLAAAYPEHIQGLDRWIFSNAGGAMGQIALLYASLREYILIFGTPIGTSGHSGRYKASVYDVMIAGEMWCYQEGQYTRKVYRPGDMAKLSASEAKSYRIPDQGWMLEYARGPIPLMLPFGLADTLCSTLDGKALGSTLGAYVRMNYRNLRAGRLG